VTLIAVSAAVWMLNRPWGGSAEAFESSDRVRGFIVRAGLQPAGRFQEPITGLEGVEIARRDCSQPAAILPVMIKDTELGPSELSYRPGDYDVAYAFDGDLYSPSWISYRLEVVAMWHRLTSLVSGSDPDRLRYYMKIWTPRGCQGLTPQEAERLRDAG
jgi:hypothetical protein